MDFELDSGQRQLQDAARRLSDGVLQPLLAEHAPDRPLPKSAMLKIFATLADFGLTGARVPVEAGGSGLAALDYAIVFEQLPPVIALAIIAHEGTASRLYASGAAQSFPDVFHSLLAGTSIACTASTEPTTGSDPRSIKLKVSASDDPGFVTLSGTKQWITNGTVADFALVTGRSGQDGALTRYLVDRAESPFVATEIDCIGLRQGHLSELSFNQVRVPRGNAVGNDNSTMKTLTLAWLTNRPLLGLLALAAAQRARDIALEHVRERAQFGAPLARKQLIQESLVDIDASVQSARLLCLSALHAIDCGRASQSLSAMAKRQAVSVAERAASLAMRLCGAMGLATETGIEREVRDIRMITIPDGTYEILTLIAGREITGESAL